MSSTPSENNGRVGALLSKHAQLIMSVCIMALAGAAGWQALESRVKSLEQAITAPEEIAVILQRVRELELRIKALVPASEIAVMHAEIKDTMREIDTLYIKAETAGRLAMENRAAHAELLGWLKGSHDKGFVDRHK